MKKSKMNIMDKTVTFCEPVSVYMLEKIQQAIEQTKETGEEQTVSLTFAELINIRRLLILDEVNTEIAYHNVKEGLEWRRTSREQKQESSK